MPICEGCDIEISLFVEADERPDDLVLDRLEALTGLTFPQYKLIAFGEFVERFEDRLKAEHVEGEAQPEMEMTGRSLEEVVKRLERAYCALQIRDKPLKVRAVISEAGSSQ